MIITRRTLFGFLAAPAIIRVADLMPVKAVVWTPPPLVVAHYATIEEVRASRLWYSINGSPMAPVWPGPDWVERVVGYGGDADIPTPVGDEHLHFHTEWHGADRPAQFSVGARSTRRESTIVRGIGLPSRCET